MSMHIGKKRIINEFFMEIDKKGNINGHLDLVSRGKVTLEGLVSEINDKDIFEPFSQPPKLTKEFENKLPLKLHFKAKNPIKQNENVWQHSSTANPPETVKEYLSTFDNNWCPNAKIYSIQIDWPSLLHIYGLSGGPHKSEAESCDFGAAENREDVEILEAKNVPGLNDVEK